MIHNLHLFLTNFFFGKIEKQLRPHLENVVRKWYRKFEASKSMGRLLKTTYKKHLLEKKNQQMKENDNILSPKK